MKTHAPVRAAAAAFFLLALLLAGCDSEGSVFELRSPRVPDPIRASDFVSEITNPLWPMTPGRTWRYEGGTASDEIEVTLVEVLPEKRTVEGVPANVVWDRVYLEGVLIEETWDWYAQDTDGNVWYLGEDTFEYKDGEIVCSCGAWESGVEGARAGIYMHAAPQVGQLYYQEYHEGVAEDTGEVLATGLEMTVEAGTYSGCVTTRDATPLQPDVNEEKTYCPGVGLVLTVDVAGGNLRDELKSFTRP